MTNPSVAVIGAGAAGYFAAINAAEQGCKVTIFEKSNKVLAKVRISGGGRCNVTNGCHVGSLAGNYPRGEKELRGPFTRFNNQNTIEWFEARGIPLKTEDDGRVFPVSNTSLSIINCLLKEAESNKVVTVMHAAVSTILKKEDNFIIEIANGNSGIFDSVIITTGGSPDIKSYQWLERLGHTVIRPVPSLFTFNIPENSFSDLMGVAVQETTVKIAGTKISQEGPLLFTHWGLSGPAVLRLSAYAARLLHEKNYDFQVIVNFSGNRNEMEVRDVVMEHSHNNARQIVASYSLFKLPLRLWERLCSLSGIKDQRWNETGKVQISKLVAALHATTFHVVGKTTFREEFVTCGGIPLKEVNMLNMESKKVPGLYFAGEVLDIDGITGGFNFQAAWTTGFIAGTSQGKRAT